MRFVVPVLLLLGLISGCNRDNNTRPDPGDTTPPKGADDLTVAGPPGLTVTLTWTATGDDGTFGRAARYDLRYANVPLTDEVWPTAAAVVSPPAPSRAGLQERFDVTGLAEGTWYFALKIGDEVPNWSARSNWVAAPVGDLTPPAEVSDLTVSILTPHTVTLFWTAPGNDGLTGTAMEYDLRHSTTLIAEESWPSAVRIPGVPPPGSPGTAESFTVTGLETGQTYYFALRTADQKPNWSPLSNPVVATPVEDINPPADVTDLYACSVNAGEATLLWTAPGSNGMIGRAAEYDLRYSRTEIQPWDFDSATRLPDVAAPAVAGTEESYTLTGLEEGQTYYFAIKTADDVPNWSAPSNAVLSAIATPVLRRLTVSTGPMMVGRAASRPDWSPDGESIAYEGRLVEHYAGDIHVISAGCGRPHRLDDRGGTGPSWSPDGEKIAFESWRNRNADIWTMDASGENPALLASCERTATTACDWSPDGLRIAYEAQAYVGGGPPACAPGIYVISATGGRPVPVVVDTFQNRQPAWSPDGTRLAFTSTRGGNEDIWVVAATGGAAVQLTNDPGRESFPRWSPDGSRIAFASERDGNSRIWIMPAAGGTPVLMENQPAGDCRYPSWSPDGHQIAFEVTTHGANWWDSDIWIARLE